MHIGGKAYFNFESVKMIPALHGSGIRTDSGSIYAGNPCGFLIELEGIKIYHAGDTGLSIEMQLLQKEEIDIALLPIGVNYTMDIDDAALSVDFIKPKTGILRILLAYWEINAETGKLETVCFGALACDSNFKTIAVDLYDTSQKDSMIKTNSFIVAPATNREEALKIYDSLINKYGNLVFNSHFNLNVLNE